MKSKESWLLMEIQETLRGFNKIEEKMRVVARTYELDKYKLHIEEIEKIISLVMSLMYRLVPLERSLNNMEWNGVEERYELERRRDKLISQLEEASCLWKSINKR